MKCDDFIFWKGNVSNLFSFSALSTMSSPWPLKHPQQGFGGGSLFTLARVMTSGQLMMSSFCQRGKNTSSPWPIQLYHRSGIRQGSWSFSFYFALWASVYHSTLFCLLSPQNFYEKPAFDYPLNQMSVWLMLGNEGLERESNDSFCAPAPSAMVFGRSDGDRVAVTRDLSLRHGYTLQFKVPVW